MNDCTIPEEILEEVRLLIGQTVELGASAMGVEFTRNERVSFVEQIADSFTESECYMIAQGEPIQGALLIGPRVREGMIAWWKKTLLEGVEHADAGLLERSGVDRTKFADNMHQLCDQTGHNIPSVRELLPNLLFRLRQKSTETQT